MGLIKRGTFLLILSLKKHLLFTPAKHRAPGDPPRTLRGENGSGGGGRLRHLHGDPLREADWELLVRRPGNTDRTEEVKKTMQNTITPLLK